MLEIAKFVETLTKAGVDSFCGVPDSLLKSFCAYITDNCESNHLITANEGGAIAFASGHYLATKNLACVYMQNSGEGNAINPLVSLADPDVYSIPMVVLIGWRGEPGIKDEPQHVKQGKVTISLLDTLQIPNATLPEDEYSAFEIATNLIATAKAESRPVALIVRKGLFAEYKLKNTCSNIATISREGEIERLLGTFPENAVIVSTTGMISRELYETRIRRNEGHHRDFLTVGSMGHALMIALGIAKAQPRRPVICLDGDGATIMQMGNLAIAGQSGCANLTHIVLNNAAHDSVGGQPTVGGEIDLVKIAEACGYNTVNGPVFREIKVSKGARKDLGRPKEKPRENKVLFMETLAK